MRWVDLRRVKDRNWERFFYEKEPCILAKLIFFPSTRPYRVLQVSIDTDTYTTFFHLSF